MAEHSVSFNPSGSADTVLPEVTAEVAAALAEAEGRPSGERFLAVRSVAGRWPRCLDAWARLAELAPDPVERYAYARVGYHRGLDQLRAAGWRGSGHVRWAAPTNRGFLSALAALQRSAGELGEVDEEERCRLFLRQLDPSWPPPGFPE